MAEKGWTARVAAAAGAAAGIGAAQLGLGYGLGVVLWPSSGMPDDSVWLGSLGWATWIAASATVFGAVLASRLGGRSAARLRGPWRFALAASAAVGALVAVALIALPARAAVRADTFSPQVIAGGYAVIGLLFGLVVAYWAVVSRPVAANLIATAVWLWALAIAAVVVELTLHRTSATYLTSWQFAESGGDHRYGTIYWPSAVLTLGAALLIGLVAALPAVRRGDLGAGTAASGAVGPLLVAAAFFVLAPQLTGALGPLESAYLIAPYAVISGLAGSALAVALGQAAANRRARRANVAVADTTVDSDDDSVPAQRTPANPKSGTELEAVAEKSGRPTTGRAKLPSTPATTNPSPAGQSVAAQPATRPSPAGQTAAQQATPPDPTSQAAAGQSSSATRPSRTGAAVPASSASATKSDEVGKRAPSKPAPAARSTAAARPASSPRATPSATTPPPAAPSPVNRQPSAPPPANPAPASEPVDDAADAEIAAAARRGRGRAKKAAPAEPAPPQPPISTVTPPPTSPTIAQINPKPPTAG